MLTKDHPLIWGHRGASGHAPENTLPAFQLAADMGADGVELDVQLTRDGIPVVCHDETVDRTGSGAGWLKDFSYSEIRKLDFSFGNAAYEGVKIPTLEEVFDLLAPSGLTVNIEIKTGIIFYDRIEEKVLKLVRDKNWEDRVIYSSFNHYTVRRIRELDPAAKVGLLYAEEKLLGKLRRPDRKQALFVHDLTPLADKADKTLCPVSPFKAASRQKNGGKNIISEAFSGGVCHDAVSQLGSGFIFPASVLIRDVT